MKYCEHIAQTISFNEKDILPCCTSAGFNPPSYYNSIVESHNIVSSIDIDKKQQEFMDIINSEAVKKYSCADCMFCKEVEQKPEEDMKIKTIFLRQWSKDYKVEEENFCLPMNYDAYELIKKLYETQKIDSENLEVKLQCDDLTTINELDKYIKLFNQYGVKTIHVAFSEKIDFNENIAKMLHTGKASINTSLDAATKELYKQIKGTENFDSNIAMLKKYAEYVEENKYALCIHYSLYKGINDNKKDIDAFLNLMKDLNIASIGVRINNANLANILANQDGKLAHYSNLITYFYEEANKANFHLDNDSCIEQNFVLAKKPQKTFLQSLFGFFK